MSDDQDRSEREFSERARQLFRESVAGLDGETRARLRQARASAVAAAAHRRPWLAPGRLVPAGAVAAALLAVALWWALPDPGAPPVATAVLDDLDLLLEGEELELFEDLEFYAWLLEQPELIATEAAEDGSG